MQPALGLSVVQNKCQTCGQRGGLALASRLPTGRSNTRRSASSSTNGEYGSRAAAKPRTPSRLAHHTRFTHPACPCAGSSLKQEHMGTCAHETMHGHARLLDDQGVHGCWRGCAQSGRMSFSNIHHCYQHYPTPLLLVRDAIKSSIQQLADISAPHP